MMKTIRVVTLLCVFGLLTVTASGVRSQSPGPLETSAPAATISAAIGYQGRLVHPDTGAPLSGTYDLEFTFWSLSGGGSQIGATIARNAQVIRNGLYNTQLAVDPADVNGQELWLQIRVRATGGTWETLTPRVQVLPTVYALSLRPGAHIQGSVAKPESIVAATNTSSGFGLRGESRDIGGFGVYGYNGYASGGYGGGVIGSVLASGYGVIGKSDSGHGVGVSGYTQDGYGVAGYDGGSEQGHGYGGYFFSSDGVGALGFSGANNTWNNMYAPGLYGRSTNGVGVYGRSEGAGSWRTAGVMGWGYGGPGGEFYTYSGNIIQGYEDVNSGDDMSLNLRFKVSYLGNVYADGTYTSPAADLAELLPARDGLEPGDVLVVALDGQLTRSSEAYQPTVVGVYSTQPGFLGGVPENTGDDENQVQQKAEETVVGKGMATSELTAEGKVPLAIAGVVPVKASAENGAITPGALLVASATPGHCMLAGANPPVGTVLGKALEGLEQGTGSILMLVMLQ